MSNTHSSSDNTDVAAGTATAPTGATTPAVRKYKFKSGTKTIRQIRKLQKGTGLLVQRAPMKRLVHEITRMFNDSTNYTKGAISALHEASEGFLIERFQNGINNTVRCGRTTLLVQDMQNAPPAMRCM